MELLGNKLLHDEGAGVASSDFSHALTRLTEPAALSSSPLFSSVVYSASHKLEFGSEVRPISEQELECVLQVYMHVCVCTCVCMCVCVID